MKICRKDVLTRCESCKYPIYFYSSNKVKKLIFDILPIFPIVARWLATKFVSPKRFKIKKWKKYWQNQWKTSYNTLAPVVIYIASYGGFYAEVALTPDAWGKCNQWTCFFIYLFFFLLMVNSKIIPIVGYCS